VPESGDGLRRDHREAEPLVEEGVEEDEGDEE
jgi:hypothetical protein